MWQSYFGPRSQIYGIDIEPSWKAYENCGVKVFIGGQADRSFWRRFRKKLKRLM